MYEVVLILSLAVFRRICTACATVICPPLLPFACFLSLPSFFLFAAASAHKAKSLSWSQSLNYISVVDGRPWKHGGGHFSSAAGIPFFIFLSGSASSHLQGKISPGVLCLIHICRSTTWRTDSCIAWGCGWVGGWGSSLTHSFPLQPPHPPPPLLPRVCLLTATDRVTSAEILPQLLLNRCFLSLFFSVSLSVYPPPHNEVILIWKNPLLCVVGQPTFSSGHCCVWASFVPFCSFTPLRFQ